MVILVHAADIAAHNESIALWNARYGPASSNTGSQHRCGEAMNHLQGRGTCTDFRLGQSPGVRQSLREAG